MVEIRGEKGNKKSCCKIKIKLTGRVGEGRRVSQDVPDLTTTATNAGVVTVAVVAMTAATVIVVAVDAGTV